MITTKPPIKPTLGIKENERILNFRQKAIQTSNKCFTSQQMCLPITVLENSDSDQEEFQNSISHFGSMDLKIEGFKEIENIPSKDQTAPPKNRKVIDLKEINGAKNKQHKVQIKRKPTTKESMELSSPIKIWNNLVNKESSNKIHWETSKTERYYIFQRKTKSLHK